MKTEGGFLLLLLLGTIALCDNTFEEVVVRATCSLQCPDSQCVNNCIQTPRKIETLDEEAGANATLVCRDVIFICLTHNPGTFVIERRLNGDNDWSHAVMSNDTTVTLFKLRSGSLYSFRLYRVLVNGISKPETTEFRTMRDTDPPMRVPKISKAHIAVDSQDPFHLRSEISFTPAEDRSCQYEVLCYDARNTNILITLDKPLEFNVTFTNLDFDTNYTVDVTALTLREMESGKTSITFSTPTCLGTHKNLTMCAPGIVDGLEATATHKVGKIYDVHVTWDVPELIPDSYKILLYPITAATEDPVSNTVSGTTNHIDFLDVKIVEQYDVQITAWSPAGGSPPIYKRFAIPEKTINPAETPIVPKAGTIIMTFLASLAFVVVTGVYAYQRHEKRKRSHRRSKYFESLDQKDGALVTIKDIGEPEPEAIIIGVKSLLTPVDEYEISADRLEMKRVLGSGAFGVVKLGSLRDDRGQVTPVAVKMLRDDPNEEELRSFDLEIKMMKSAGQHPNIVSLLGCCTIGPRPLLVVEYCSRGDLQTYLRAILEKATVSVQSETTKYHVSNSRSPASNKILEDNSEESFSASLSSEDDGRISSFVANHAYDIDRDAFRDTDMVTVTDLLNFGRQIATGMEFLSSNRVVHRDLAARNVLVCNDRTVKISDFGLSRDIYQENIYRKQGNGRVPVKWMAIEALTHQVYSTYSDVWSFGILLWEIVTLGSSPYPDIPANGVLKRLRSGYRMERPPNCSIPLYNVMLSCWQAKPRDRPTFTILRLELDKLICVATESEYLDLHEISKSTPPENEDLQISSSPYNHNHTYLPLQARYANEFEPRVIPNVRE